MNGHGGERPRAPGRRSPTTRWSWTQPPPRSWNCPRRDRVEQEGKSPGVTHPLGFLAAGVAAGIKRSGRLDVGVVVVAPESRHEVVSAAVFTRNAFAAAPVIVSQRETSLSKLAAVVMNSGNANACTGVAGLATARAMQSACGNLLGSRQHAWVLRPRAHRGPAAHQ